MSSLEALYCLHSSIYCTAPILIQSLALKIKKCPEILQIVLEFRNQFSSVPLISDAV